MHYTPKQLWESFKLNFPETAKRVVKFKEHGPREIVLFFKQENPLLFRLNKNKTITITNDSGMI